MKSAPTASEATPESPWLGLRSFSEESSAYFFGRETELRDLEERVVHKPLTVLFGQSGWGKTSLLQAGMVPRMRRSGLLPVPMRLAHDEGAAPLEMQVIHALVNALANAGHVPLADRIKRELAATDRTALWLVFHDPRFGFADAEEGASVSPVFILDQFEEIFTLGEKPDRQEHSAAFREALSSLVENRPPPAVRRLIEEDEYLADRLVYREQRVRVLLALRYDFLHLLERWRGQMPSVMDNRMELRLLGGVQAFEAVVRPGQIRQGKPPIIPDDVGRAIVRFVANVGPGVPLSSIDAVPPLLSLVCAELNAQRLDLGKEEVSQSQFEGHSAEILDSFYERSFDPGTYGDRLESTPQAARALRALRSLVEDRLLSAEGYRESVAFDTMQWELSRAADASVAKQVLPLLIERRLLSVEERGGVPRLELTHDVLTRIARASRDARKETEAVERARQEQERAEAETRKALAEKNRLRRFAVIAGVCAVIATVSAAAGIMGMIRARQAAREANEGFNAARTATDDFLSRIASEEMAYVPGIQEVREEMANKAIAQYEGMLKTRPDDTTLRLALAKGRKARADILGQIGSIDEATTAFKASITELTELAEVDQSSEVRILLADASVDYAAFCYNEELPGWQPHTTAAIEMATPFLEGEWKREAAITVSRGRNLFGNGESDREKKIVWFEMGRQTAMSALAEAKAEDPVSLELLTWLAATTWNLSRQLSFGDTQVEKVRAQEHREAGIQMDDQLRASQPDSPRQQLNRAISMQWRADELNSQGRAVEARKQFDEAVRLWRASAHNNPGVAHFQRSLVQGLKDYGIFLSRANDFESARAAYEEAAVVAEKMIGKRGDRPANGSALMEVMNQLSEFQQHGKTGKDQGDPEAAARVRERAIKLGRELVAKYPDAIDLSHEYTKILVQHARYEPVKSDAKRAMELFQEALALMEGHRKRNPQSLKPWHVSNYLSWISSLDDLKLEADKTAVDLAATNAARVQLLDSGLEWFSLPNNYDGKQSLMTIADRRAELHLEAKQPELAKALLQKTIAHTEGDYQKKPYFWYYRNSFSGLHSTLGKIYQTTGDKESEARARQKEIEIGYVSNYGRKPFEAVLTPDLPLTDENLTKLRTVADWAPKMKMFVIPCEVNGVRVPVQFYICGGVPEKDADPLADQARWIDEERGVRVPADVRDSLRKLAAIAHENNVDLADLCTYALNYPSDGSSSTSKAPDSPEAKLAELQKRAGANLGLAKAVPGDETKQVAAAKALEECGKFLADRGEYAKAEVQYLEALVIRQQLLALKPKDDARMDSVGMLHWRLGYVYSELKESSLSVFHYLQELQLTRNRLAAAPDDDNMQLSLADSLEKVRDLAQKHGVVSDALRYGSEVVQVREKLLAKKPDDPTYQRKYAVSLHNHGVNSCLDGWAGIERSLPPLARASEIMTRLGAAGHLNEDQATWPELCRKWSREASTVIACRDAFQVGNPTTWLDLGRAILAMGPGKLGKSRTDYAVSVLLKYPLNHPGGLEAQKLLVSQLRNEGRDEQALVHLGHWLALEQDSLEALDIQADVHFDAKRFQEAAVSYRRILDHWRKTVERDTSKRGFEETFRAWLNLGTCLMNAKIFDQAEEQFLGALQWRLAPERKDVMSKETEIECREKLVHLYASASNQAAKAVPHQQAISALLSADLDSARQQKVTKGHEAADARSRLARIQLTAGQSKDAAANYEASLALWQQQFFDSRTDSNFKRVYDDWLSLMDAMSEEKKYEEGLNQARAALAFMVEHGPRIVAEGTLAARRLNCHRRAANFLTVLGRFGEATVERQAIVDLNLQMRGKFANERDVIGSTYEISSSYSSLAWSQLFARRFDSAIASGREGMKAHPQIWVEMNLAHALLFNGNYEEALAIYRKHRGKKLEVNDSVTWEDALKTDISMFRRGGLEHGDLAKLEAELGITPEKPAAPPK